MKRTVKLTESKLRDMVQEAVDGAMAQRRPAKKTQPKRLTESRLRNMINEAVKKALKESTVDDLRQRALNGDIDAWATLGLGSSKDWDAFDKWRREKSGMSSYSSNEDYYNWKNNPNDGRQFSPEWWH